MADNDLVSRYFAVVGERRLWSSPKILHFYMKYLLGHVSLPGKTLLDIGGGSGLFDFYAVAAGAAKAVCLEPEAEGSSAGMRTRFEQLREWFGTDRVVQLPCTFQGFEPGGERFDVVLLHNSINHVDEAACIVLHREAAAREAYTALFRRMFELTAPGGRLIIADCARRNLFGDLGVRNPMVPTIQWYKHQSPRLWATLLANAGFTNPRIRWTSFNVLGRLGAVFLRNRLAAYLLVSHFCLTMDRP